MVQAGRTTFATPVETVGRGVLGGHFAQVDDAAVDARRETDARSPLAVGDFGDVVLDKQATTGL
jgi:hypothetical protein